MRGVETRTARRRDVKKTLGVKGEKRRGCGGPYLPFEGVRSGPMSARRGLVGSVVAGGNNSFSDRLTSCVRIV
jgi:hypothetical protein